MATKKIRLSAPTKASHGRTIKVRFDYSKKAFILTRGGKQVDEKTFKNPETAQQYIDTKL